ncbi:MAG: DUF2095 domain-containing protein [Candidatus Lokiarchaeota archaeon]|nr:DUF2095 domain-containing protein [Candidatus Lokiarchaeota archaeon]
MDKKEKLRDQKIGHLHSNGKLSDKGITIDYDRESVEEHLPNLAAELNDPDHRSVLSIKDYKNNLKKEQHLEKEDSIAPIDVESTKLEIKQYKRRIKETYKSKYDENSELFYPKTEDFLRRCSNLKEVREILEYQVKMKEITRENAENLWKKCKEEGIRSLGSKKEWGYYEKKYRAS